MSRHPTRVSGFTILEMVISIAIITFISLVLSQVFLVTLRTNAKTETRKDIKQNGELALERMVRLIQNARLVTCVSGQSITIINPDRGSTSYTCDFAGGNTMIASISAEGTRYLTSTNVTTGGIDCTGSTLTFDCSSPAGLPSSVTISFSLAPAGTPDSRFAENSESFTTSAVMRNTPSE